MGPMPKPRAWGSGLREDPHPQPLPPPGGVSAGLASCSSMTHVLVVKAPWSTLARDDPYTEFQGSKAPWWQKLATTLCFSSQFPYFSRFQGRGVLCAVWEQTRVRWIAERRGRSQQVLLSSYRGSFLCLAMSRDLKGSLLGCERSTSQPGCLRRTGVIPIYWWKEGSPRLLHGLSL